MRKILSAGAFLALSALSPGSAEMSGVPTTRLAASDAVVPWSEKNGTPVQVDAKGKAYVNFPTTPPGVNYLTRAARGFSNNSSVIFLDYTITATGTPVFDYRTNPNNTCGPGFPGVVRLFLQRSDDNLSGDGAFQQYRYWSKLGFRKLEPGSFRIMAVIDPAQWTDVYGRPGSDFPERFRDALKYIDRVGVTFGGGCFYGHGVFNSGVGSAARFVIDAFVFQ